MRSERQQQQAAAAIQTATAGPLIQRCLWKLCRQQQQQHRRLGLQQRNSRQAMHILAAAQSLAACFTAVMLQHLLQQLTLLLMQRLLQIKTQQQQRLQADSGGPLEKQTPTQTSANLAQRKHPIAQPAQASTSVQQQQLQHAASAACQST
jgi:hypothetical protein